MFADKVFRYRRGDSAGRAEASAYGVSAGARPASSTEASTRRGRSSTGMIALIPQGLQLFLVILSST